MALIGLEISIFLFAAFLGYIIAIRIGQSSTIGMILIGLVLGPSFLGLVSFDSGVRLLSEIGAILLLFVVGLESNFRDVYSARNAVVALFGVLVPFACGFAVARLFGYSSISALMVGTAITATSIAITAHVLKEMGKLSSRSAKTLIGAAVIDDVLGLMVLAIATGTANGAFSLQRAGIVAISAILFFAIVILLIPFISEIASIVNRWAESIGYPQITLLLALSVAFAYSAVSELIGLSAIVGAFVAGVTLESSSIKSYKEGAAYIEMIFSSIFFVSLGVVMNLKEVDFSSWLFVLALIAVAVLTKVIGCFIPALLTGLGRRESLIVGFGMVARGEVASIVALFGLSAGLISQTIYTAIMLVAVSTTLIAPIILKRLYAR